MYQSLGEHCGDALQTASRVFSVSGSQELCRVLGADPAAVEDAQFPDVDLLDLTAPDSSFDALVADQVLEHVAGPPERAISESFRVVKPGGLVVHTTCFMNPVHAAPSDYWRFTPEALELLAKRHGEVLYAGGWGNQVAVFLAAVGLKREPVPVNPRHPLHRIAIRPSSAWPIVTWIVARRHAVEERDGA